MNFFKRLGGRSAGQAPIEEPDATQAADLPIDRFDHSGGKELTDKFRTLTQAQLEEVETYERSHKERPAILAKLRYLRSKEPLPGYDGLSPDEISTAIAGADAETVKAVRDYERKFQRRQSVLQEAARVLPEAAPSAKETQAQEEKDARVASKMRSS